MFSLTERRPMILSSSRTDIAVLYAVRPCRGEGKGRWLLGTVGAGTIQMTGRPTQNKGVTTATPTFRAGHAPSGSASPGEQDERAAHILDRSRCTAT